MVSLEKLADAILLIAATFITIAIVSAGVFIFLWIRN
jgi:hypothetical protein